GGGGAAGAGGMGPPACAALTFAPEVPYPAGAWSDAVTVADLNGDGAPDLVVTNGHYNSDPSDNDDTVSVLLNHGDGTFAAKVDYFMGIAPVWIAAADLNGDGKPDLAVTDRIINSVFVMLGH